MKVTIEVVADEREDIVKLVREIATNLKNRREKSGTEVNYCMGDYRVIVEEYDEPRSSSARTAPTSARDRSADGKSG